MFNIRSLSFSAFFFVLVFMNWAETAWAQPKVYFSDSRSNTILRANLDGSNLETLITGLRAVRGIAVNPVGKKLYWVDESDGHLSCSNLDGTGPADLALFSQPEDVVVDTIDYKVYLSQGNETRSIVTTNFDGANATDVFITNPSSGYGAFDFDIDFTGKKAYWTDSSLKAIYRASLTASPTIETIADNANSNTIGTPRGIALDVPNSTIYYCASNSIQRLDLNGGNESTFVSLGSATCQSVALDLKNKNLYVGFSDSTIGVSIYPLDGSKSSTFYTSMASIQGIAVDTTLRTVDPSVVPDAPEVIVTNNSIKVMMERYVQAKIKATAMAVCRALRPFLSAKKRSPIVIVYQVQTQRVADENSNPVSGQIKKIKSKRNTLTIRRLAPGTYNVSYKVLLTQQKGGVVKVVGKTPFSKTTSVTVTPSA